MLFRTTLFFAAVVTIATAQAPTKSNPPKSPSTSAKPSPNGALTSGDRKFLDEALQGNRAEVALGRLASQKAADPQVKAFGEMMVKDHGQGVMEIESLMKDMNVPLPAEKQPSVQAKLEKLSGAAFDKAYISDMVADHKKDVAAFKKESTSASNPEVRNLATKMLPTLQMHLDRVTMINSQLAKKNTADRTAVDQDEFPPKGDTTPTDRR